MTKVSIASFAAAVVLSVCQSGFSQLAIGKSAVSKVSVGMSVEAAQAVLRSAEVPVAEPKPFTAHPAGDRWLFYVLAKETADLVIRYSPAEEQVTGISVHYLTTPRSRTEIAVPVSSIQFFADGSYFIHHPSRRPPSAHTQGVDTGRAFSKAAAKESSHTHQKVKVDDIGTAVSLTGRLGEPLGSMLTVSGTWGYPSLRVKDYSVRFSVTSVNGKQLARPVMFPVHAVHVSKDGVSAVPPHARHKELDGVTWSLRAYETGRFTTVPAEYWRERGAPAMIYQPAFASELVGFVR